jgi:hypothetical protein
MIPSERQAPTIARRQLAEATRAILVAADSRAACSQDLPLARLATAAAVSGSQRYCNLRIDDHSSAHGTPNARSALHTTFCVRSFAVMTSVSSAMSLRGTRVLRRVRVPHLKPSTARDFGLPPKQHWPQRGRGMGDAPGPTTGRSPIESASAAWEQSSRAALLSVGFSTRSTKDRSGVSAQQRHATIDFSKLFDLPSVLFNLPSVLTYTSSIVSRIGLLRSHAPDLLLRRQVNRPLRSEPRHFGRRYDINLTDLCPIVSVFRPWYRETANFTTRTKVLQSIVYVLNPTMWQ